MTVLQFRHVTALVIGVAIAASSFPVSVFGSPDSLADEYRIGPEDVLDVTVWNHPDIARTVPVRPDGRISLPLVNDVVAAGLTAGELRDLLTEKFTLYFPSPEISIIVREIHSFKVSVMGNVRAPGRFELKSRTTVLDALALAGGFTEFAERRRVIVLRHDGAAVKRLRFDYDDAVSESGSSAPMFLRPGDVVVVP